MSSDNGKQNVTSVLTIIFQGPGSSEFRVEGHDVSPTQQLLVGRWLQVHAQYIMEQAWNQQLADAIRERMQSEALVRKVLQTKR